MTGDPDGHKGFCYYPSKKQALVAKQKWDSETNAPGYSEQAMKHDAEIRELEIKPTMAGILRALNVYGGHPDNG